MPMSRVFVTIATLLLCNTCHQTVYAATTVTALYGTETSSSHTSQGPTTLAPTYNASQNQEATTSESTSDHASSNGNIGPTSESSSNNATSNGIGGSTSESTNTVTVPSNGSGHNIIPSADLLPSLMNNLETMVAMFGGTAHLMGELKTMAFGSAHAMIESLKAKGVSATCADDMDMFLAALNHTEEWAIKMVDALGKLPSNILGGNLKWLGNIDECEEIDAVAEGRDTFTGKYCRVGVELGILKQVAGEVALAGVSTDIEWGMCTSNHCSSDDVKLIMDSVFEATGMDVSAKDVTCVDMCTELETDAIVVICIVDVLVALVVIGTLYDILVIQMCICGPSQKKNTYSLEQDSSNGKIEGGIASVRAVSNVYELERDISDSAKVNHAFEMENGTAAAVHDKTNGYETIGTISGKEDRESGSNGVDTSQMQVTNGTGNSTTAMVFTQNIYVDDNTTKAAHKTPAVHGTPPARATKEETKQKTTNTLVKILLAFSVYTNGRKLLSTSKGAGSLGAVNGVRFLSMSWVILGHTYYFAMNYSENVAVLMTTYLNRITFNSIMYASVSVDSFFALSGILVSYLTLKHLKQVHEQGTKTTCGWIAHWLMFYFHRFWRLTPVYMLVILVGTVLLPYFSTGPQIAPGEPFPLMENCRTQWWVNLLYINNLVKPESQCMAWSWYLANDMQYYILSPLILIPLFYNVIAGWVSAFVFLVATVTASITISYIHEYPAQTGPGVPPPKDAHFFKNLYDPTHTRMGPYIVGLLTGYMLYRLKCKCRMPKWLAAFLWLVCFAGCSLIIYGPYLDHGDNIFTNLESALYTGFSRPLWGLAVSWVVFACATGNGGWIDSVLSWGGFSPLARLTYCAYLIHPLITYLYYGSRTHAVYYSNFNVIYLFLGNLVLTYGTAFIVSLAFEAPMMGLEKIMFKKK